MYICLLSGGSGKRLWPLSNSLRSKQYIKILEPEKIADKGAESSASLHDSVDPKNPESKYAPDAVSSYCSMLQRVWGQLGAAGFGEDKRLLTAGQGQREIIQSQLGNVKIAVEPDRRDTFPAVLLSCAYAHEVMGADPDEAICFLPVDPYAEQLYFQTLASLEGVLQETGADVVLMGVRPEKPESKFGYFVPETGAETGSRDTRPTDSAVSTAHAASAPAVSRENRGTTAQSSYFRIARYVEKPAPDAAAQLVADGALVNCGVFCMKIGSMLDLARSLAGTASYEALYRCYDRLPKISFDYQVLEHSDNLCAVPYSGMWKDLGTWDALSGEMALPSLGDCALRDCHGTNAVNELEIPLLAVGCEDLMIVASYDGILVAPKDRCPEIKSIADTISTPPRYEERRWGTLKTLESAETPDGFTLLRKIRIFDRASSSYHYHNDRIEIMTVLSGQAEMILDGAHLLLSQGSSVTIPSGKKHAIRASRDFEYLETHIGRSIGDEDIHRITFDWNEIAGA
ncbi:MAG: sugar phosphate nucleotidyltransferase [Eubacteriales bacterium]|nr:sugar phosphate nucleotidyltransferase [Eubacteriales bacterium]